MSDFFHCLIEALCEQGFCNPIIINIEGNINVEQNYTRPLKPFEETPNLCDQELPF
jgi:hypothetical protein